MSNIFDVIKERKSVRTYDGNMLSETDRNDIKDFAGDIKNPFDIPVSFVFLDAKEHGLSSPVLSGEMLYVAGKVKKEPYADVAFGYSFEKLVLFAWSRGIGTVLIGGTMKRENFERAAGLKEGEMMPCISPLGYPAKKRSIKENMMRKGVGADVRLSPEELFFEGEWGRPYTPKGDEAKVFDAVRWAPSAVNKQPWRIIVKEGKYHFYEKKDKGYVKDATGDLQKIDVGIALCHFVAGFEEIGRATEVLVSDPGLNIPDGVEYICSVG